MNNNAAIYLRVSTADQVQFGVSLDAQEERVRAYCTMAGLNVVAIIREEGVSAGKPLAQRPGGRELLEMLAAGKAQHVATLKLDRAFRDTVDCLTQTRQWDKNGIAFHVVDMGGQTLNTASAMGRMFLTMCAGFAELERGLVSERTRTAMAHMKANGAKFGSPVLDEEATLARILELRDAELSLREMAGRLESEGHKTKRGGRWAPETLRKILARLEAV